MLAVTAVATAGNGAVLDISLIVHAPQPFSADGAADAWAATTAWCAGEIDDAIVSGYGYSFTTVDVTATAREGEWPDDAPLQVFPVAYEYSTITAYGDLWQVDASAEIDPPESVPHCKRPVVLDGAGSGQVYLGIAGDVDGDGDGTPPLGGWVHHLLRPEHGRRSAQRRRPTSSSANASPRSPRSAASSALLRRIGWRSSTTSTAWSVRATDSGLST